MEWPEWWCAKKSEMLERPFHAGPIMGSNAMKEREQRIERLKLVREASKRIHANKVSYFIVNCLPFPPSPLPSTLLSPLILAS